MAQGTTIHQRAAILGAGAGSVAFAIVSAVAGAAVGGLVGGVTNTAIGNGTFGDGFRIGAAAGFVGGLLGGSLFYSSRGAMLNFSNNLARTFTSLLDIKSSVFPLSAQAATTATLSMAGFVYDQVSRSCDEGEAYDWKTNRCQPSAWLIPIPISE